MSSSDSTSRILVIANATVESPIIRDAIAASAGDTRAEVLIVAPALNSRMRHWLSDDGDARRRAVDRLRRSVERLRRDGIEARGAVGDADPLQAIADSLSIFDADRLVIATHPEGRSNWLARGLVERARRRFALPVLHIVVDGLERAEYVLDAGGGRHASQVRAAA
jgi:hypothetical protein